MVREEFIFFGTVDMGPCHSELAKNLGTVDVYTGRDSSQAQNDNKLPK